MNEESQVQDVNEQTTEQEVKEAPVNEVPYNRFKEVIDDKNTLKAELDALKHQVVQIAEMKSQLEVYQLQEQTKREMLLDKLSDDDKAIYGSLDNNALEAHIQRLNKQSVPSVGNDQPAETQGYKSLLDAARDFQKGKIDEPIYKRIKNAFRANQV